MLLRLRHTPAGNASTLLRAQFHTGFVKLFRQSFPAGACDGGEKLPAELEVTCVFAPSDVPRELGDPYEELISRESSALWGEVMRRKETRMGHAPAQGRAIPAVTDRCVRGGEFPRATRGAEGDESGRGATQGVKRST